jgi:hypothetical protein
MVKGVAKGVATARGQARGASLALHSLVCVCVCREMGVVVGVLGDSHRLSCMPVAHSLAHA